MHTAIIVLHVILCLFLILVILLQTGRGGEMGAVFGGSSSTTFGGRGAGTFLSKTTSVTAVLFMVTSLALAILSSQVDDTSVISDDVVPLQSTAAEVPPLKPGPGAGDTAPRSKAVKPSPIGTSPTEATRGTADKQADSADSSSKITPKKPPG